MKRLPWICPLGHSLVPFSLMVPNNERKAKRRELKVVDEFWVHVKEEEAHVMFFVGEDEEDMKTMAERLLPEEVDET